MATDDAFTITGRTYRAQDAVQYQLPAVLREISGLTLDDAGRLYGHDDEQAVVYQIDYQHGRVLKRFALEGNPKADFEGIAWLEGRLYMVTSSGRLYEFADGPADSFVPYQRLSAGLDCEVEGLTGHRGRLLAACKNRPKGKKALHFHDWSPGADGWSEKPTISIKRSQFDALFATLGTERPDKFQPTAITSTPEGHLLVIAGPQKVLLEFTSAGVPVAVAGLDPNRHSQPEGIAITTDGTLLIADEGDNRGSNRSPGRLSIYRPDSITRQRQ